MKQQAADAVDVVFIHGLQVDAVIGVYEWEQQIIQPLVFDIEMAADQRQAAANDDIAAAINYKTVSERVTQVCREQQVALIERLAQLVAEMILAEFAPERVTVTLYKPTAVKEARYVGVKITRWQTDK